MRQSIYCVAGVTCLAIAVATAADAQTLNIWPGVAPGSENWTQQERVEEGPSRNILYNVVTPTLTVYLPDKAEATGTGVIIAPGGAFRILSIDFEGHDVARWLQARGIAAFVLKYRVIETPTGFKMGAPAAGREAAAPRATGRAATAPGAGGREAAAPAAAGRGAAGGTSMDDAGRYGIADGIQALKVVRRHAAEWGIAPNRVGFLGFSAGAMVTTGTLLQDDAAARPNFAAPIYGGPFGVMPPIPAGLPPIFLAWAQDDTLVGPTVVKFYDALRAAGYRPEVHIFSAGGHGFGMIKKGTSSDHWIDAFYYWLEAQGFTKPAAK
jgi:acetyl esterase/lipase